MYVKPINSDHTLACSLRLNLASSLRFILMHFWINVSQHKKMFLCLNICVGVSLRMYMCLLPISAFLLV